MSRRRRLTPGDGVMAVGIPGARLLSHEVLPA
jgi:hypothetical protein